MSLRIISLLRESVDCSCLWLWFHLWGQSFWHQSLWPVLVLALGPHSQRNCGKFSELLRTTYLPSTFKRKHVIVPPLVLTYLQCGSHPSLCVMTHSILPSFWLWVAGHICWHGAPVPVHYQRPQSSVVFLTPEKTAHTFFTHLHEWLY